MDQAIWRDTSQADSTTLTECLDRYLKEVSPHKKSGSHEGYKARNILRHNVSKLTIFCEKGINKVVEKAL